jgi:hypothetical protein
MVTCRTKGLRINNWNILACPVDGFLRCDPRDIAPLLCLCGRAWDSVNNPARYFVQLFHAQALIDYFGFTLNEYEHFLCNYNRRSNKFTGTVPA